MNGTQSLCGGQWFCGLSGYMRQTADLHISHVHLIDIGALLPVHLYIDKPPIHHLGHLLALKALPLHHVAPVAGTASAAPHCDCTSICSLRPHCSGHTCCNLTWNDSSQQGGLGSRPSESDSNPIYRSALVSGVHVIGPKIENPRELCSPGVKPRPTLLVGQLG